MDMPPATISHLIAEASSGVPFSNQANDDLYWQALILIGKNQKEEAQTLANAIRSNAPLTLVSFPWKMHPPPTLSEAFDKLFISAVRRDPQGLSFLGLFESINLKAHNAFLNDLSILARRADLNEAKADLQMLQTFKIADSPEQDVTLKSCLWKLRHSVAGEPSLMHSYPATQLFGALQSLTELFTVYHRLDTAEDCENYLKRLSKIPEQFQQLHERMKTQEENGIVPPRFALEKQIQMIDRFLNVPVNLFYRHLKEHCRIIN